MCCDCTEESTPPERYEPTKPEPGTSNGGGGGGSDNKPSRGERDKPGTSDNSTNNPSDSQQTGSGQPTIPGIIIPSRPRRIRRLWCQTGFDLAIFPNGKVRGTKSPRNKYGLLEFEAAGLDGQIRIKGVVTGFYVTMTPKGRVHAQPHQTNRGTIWVETKLGSGTAYHSLLSLDYAHRGYYLAIKKSGKPKSGPKTTHPHPQRAISFLSRIVLEE